MTTHSCKRCDIRFDSAEFDLIDDELDLRHPLCPSCSAAIRLRDQTCVICGEPAPEEVELGFLCDEHHDDYCDGALRD